MPRAASTLAPQSHIARAAQLGEEIGQRKTVLDDASIIGPSLKLIAGIIILAAGAVLWSNYQQTLGHNLACDSSCQLGGTLGLVSFFAGPGLILWGGIQLIISIVRNVTIPGEIHAREAELHELDGRSRAVETP